MHRVGSNVDETAVADRKEKVEQVKQPVQRRTSAPVDSISAAIAAKRSDAANKVGIRPTGGLDTTMHASASSPTASVDVASETERIPKIVQRARTVQSLIKRSCVDAGTDPLESFMSNSKPIVIQTPSRGCEMETQTVLPPAPLLSVPKSGSLRGLGSGFSLTPEEQHEQNNEESTRPEVSSSEVDRSDVVWQPQHDGDAIEDEMKRFLIQHAADSSVAVDNQIRAEEQPEEDVDPAKFWSDSPRLDAIKTAELRKPPTSLLGRGYRSFRMPSRQASSDST
ncbi:unnamed protein product [Phytophthora lilii]|uniref:Unnamed protein product n=1 Tax=Phytophthora lilii TaxID=2077276 RepID=A0A9W6WND9_9STRA|nr:unnamed protein product [Phytophthora lilii]